MNPATSCVASLSNIATTHVQTTVSMDVPSRSTIVNCCVRILRPDFVMRFSWAAIRFTDITLLHTNGTRKGEREGGVASQLFESRLARTKRSYDINGPHFEKVSISWC